MPRSIKMFIWLGCAYIVWSSFWNFQLQLWPTAHYSELLAKAPADDRAIIEQGELYAALTRTVCFVLPFAVFGILASFFRQAWARWGVLLAFLVQETALLIAVGHAYLLHPAEVQSFLPLIQSWLQSYRFDATHWVHWVGIGLRIVLFVLLFLPDAKRWFGRHARFA